MQKDAILIGHLVTDRHLVPRAIAHALQKTGLSIDVEIVPAFYGEPVNRNVLCVGHSEYSDSTIQHALNSCNYELHILNHGVEVGAIFSSHILVMCRGVKHAGVVLNVLPIHPIIDNISVSDSDIVYLIQYPCLLDFISIF